MLYECYTVELYYVTSVTLTVLCIVRPSQQSRNELGNSPANTGRFLHTDIFTTWGHFYNTHRDIFTAYWDIFTAWGHFYNTQGHFYNTQGHFIRTLGHFIRTLGDSILPPGDFFCAAEDISLACSHGPLTWRTSRDGG